MLLRRQRLARAKLAKERLNGLLPRERPLQKDLAIGRYGLLLRQRQRLAQVELAVEQLRGLLRELATRTYSRLLRRRQRLALVELAASWSGQPREQRR